MEGLYYKENDHLKLFTLVEHALGKGKQGAVYSIVLPVYLSDFCVKIYHKPCTKELIARLQYMINNPPRIIKTNFYCICWPKGFVYDSKENIVGFYMPKSFANSRDLSILSFYAKGKTISDRFKDNKDWFNKYERNTSIGILNRLKMMMNIAQAFYQIHKMGKYVVLDVKPLNMLATSNGKISIVDTDSFQISENEKILFPGAAATPEYCAPEFEEQYKQGRSFTVSNDLFSLSVMFYQFLIGVHPFAGAKLLPPYDIDEYSELQAVIHRSLFLYGCNKRYLEALSPNPHIFFERIPHSLQLMFIRAFDAPNYRPSMDEWCKEFYKLIVK